MSTGTSLFANRLGSRRARRLAVILIVTTTALLTSLVPTSLHGFAIVVVLALVSLDGIIIRATGGLAFSRRAALDEREMALRDLAYRRGFRLLGLAVVLALVLIVGTGILASVTTNGSSGLGIAVVDNGITGRVLVALLESLVMMPTLVIAWIDRDRIDADDRPQGSRLVWLAVPALAVAWLTLTVAAPEQAAATTTHTSFSMAGATCAPFAAGRIIGTEFGATVGMRAGVCWNGHDAFVVGDPAIPLPQSAIDAMFAQLPPDARTAIPPAFINPAQPDVTACGADNLDDFATVSATTCTGRIDSAGTLHYTVRARVAGLFGLGQRDVVLTLVVDRNGRVLERP
jgi:hypothetical protein